MLVICHVENLEEEKTTCKSKRARINAAVDWRFVVKATLPI